MAASCQQCFFLFYNHRKSSLIRARLSFPPAAPWRLRTWAETQQLDEACVRVRVCVSQTLCFRSFVTVRDDAHARACFKFSNVVIHLPTFPPPRAKCCIPAPSISSSVRCIETQRGIYEEADFSKCWQAAERRSQSDPHVSALQRRHFNKGMQW